MSGLVGSPPLEAQPLEQWVPDAVGHVVVVERRAVTGTEHELELPGRGLLVLQRLIDQSGHVDRAEGAVRLGRDQLPAHQGLMHQDLAPLEVHVFPRQSVDLAGPHAREETHGVVIPEIRPDVLQDEAHLLQREWLNIGPGNA